MGTRTQPSLTSTDTAPDLRAGAEVIVFARIASVLFLAAFIQFLDKLPYRPLLAVILGGAALLHLAWWQRYVRGSQPMTRAVAIWSLMGDAIAIGVAVILTGGPQSPVVFIWAATFGGTAIWLGLRDGLPVLVTAVAFLFASAVIDVGVEPNFSDLQMAVFTGFWLTIIMFHGSVVAAYKRAFQAEIDVAEERATIDALTGLANRAAFDARLIAEVHASEECGGGFSVAMIDIDDFKLINDTHGHTTGDQVLRVLAEHMRAEVRAGDLVARLGGEEFALIMSDATPDAARQVIDRVRLQLAADGPVPGAAFSAGVAHYPASGRDCDALLSAADTAMYAAKRGGKGWTVIAEPAGWAAVI